MQPARTLVHILLAASLLPACRADVEGGWQGIVGSEAATLSLDQRGSAIYGDVCIGGNCAAIDRGNLEEDHLELDFGCSRCPLPDMSLDLTLLGDQLDGEARLWGCACAPNDPDCNCNPHAHFGPCAGSCGSPAATNTSAGGGGGADPSMGGSP